MLVRIRWNESRLEGVRPLRTVALAAAGLLVPSALLAFVMAFWSMAADIRWTSDFIISRGLLSHWQIWLIAAFILAFSARLLDQYARSEHYTERHTKDLF